MPKPYLLPPGLEEYRKHDKALNDVIEGFQERNLPIVKMYEGLTAFLVNRSEFYLKTLLRYRKKFGDLPPEEIPDVAAPEEPEEPEHIQS